jgi:predicted unusual protein kinase regulating ubiquinone biosynthesis (AarF/ABC1/UbiB family)
MSTLEGIARSLDPSFNVFQVMYPFALNKLLTNPTNSPVVDRTLQDLIRDKNSQRVDLGKVAQLLKDSALITGYSSKRVLYDIMKTRGGRRLGLTIAKEEARLRNPLSRKKAGAFMKRSAARFLRL